MDKRCNQSSAVAGSIDTVRHKALMHIVVIQKLTVRNNFKSASAFHRNGQN